MREFGKYHPIVNFAYFVAVVVFSGVFMHPVCLAISLICSFCYSIMSGGVRSLKFNILYMLPLFIITALMNPAFNHEGITILAYFPDGNPLTLESIIFGICAAVMLCTVILWFSCYNKIMSSDKFIYLFGKIIPSLSLVLSMVFRFVPKFKVQLTEVMTGQKHIGRDISEGGIIKRAKTGIRILSIMIGMSLENSITTIDSMKSRGYGLPNRTSFSNFTFDKRDIAVFFAMLVLFIYVIAGGILGVLEFQYFPKMSTKEMSFYSFSVFFAYLTFSAMPIVIEILEVLKWKLLRHKI